MKKKLNLKVDYINIQNVGIHGIINPTFIMKGNCDLDDYSFRIIVDGEIAEPVINRDYQFRTYDVCLKLTNKQKKVEVFVINKDNEQFLYVCENTRLKRMKTKIKSIIVQFKYVLIRIGKIIKFIFSSIIKGICMLWEEDHFLVSPKKYKYYFQKLKNKIRYYDQENIFYIPDKKKEYLKWLEIYEKNEIVEEKFDYNPLVSICIPVYNVKKKYLSECLDSILNQTYQNFEICIVDDCSTNEETLQTLREYQNKDGRIHILFKKDNGHISKTTNDAVSMANGEFIGLVDNDDLLAPNALYECIKELNENRYIDFIYTDEDKLDLDGKRCLPHFKPDWSPDTLFSLNYICHFVLLRKSILKEIGGFTIGLEGAQDYDLFLRYTEKTSKIKHIPKILYHWRMIEGSTAVAIDNKSYATDNGKISIENALKRRGICGHVQKDKMSTYYRVVYDIDPQSMVSIIIPTKDHADITRQCLNSIYTKTTYNNYEVIVMNNNSNNDETYKLFEEYKNKYHNFRVIDANYEFNYSKINNEAVTYANGDYICLLNNDTEIISDNWLEVMLGYASQPHIGAVGPKLLYPDETVQHGGVILGLGGVASHAYIGASRIELGMYGRLRVPYNYSAVTAACLLVSKRKFIEVGGLEEDLKVAYNDIDFNIKLLKKGYFNVFLPQIEIFHYESKSRGLDTKDENKYKRFIKESEYMYKKWKNELENDKFYNVNFSKKGWFVLDRLTEQKKGEN